MSKAPTPKVTLITGLFLMFIFSSLPAQSPKVPGTVVHYIPASDETYIGSPSLCILPNGDYVASHDHFGPGSTEHQQALTLVYRSTDRGKTWKKISAIEGQFDGRDIIFLSRTAYDDGLGGAHNNHDANYLTFHRLKNYKKYQKRAIKP